MTRTVDHSFCVIGIDPGIADLGYGIIRSEHDREPQYVDSGIVKTSAEQSDPLRVAKIQSAIRSLIAKYHPDFIVVEKYVGKPFQAVRVGKVMGAIELLAVEYSIPIEYVAQSSWKAELCGGRATKGDIQEFVREHFDVEIAKTRNHESDAIGIALAGYRLFCGGGIRHDECETA